MRSPTYGYVLGRFQPLHLGHMEYLEAACRRCHRLIVGITNPDRPTTAPRAADPKRSDPSANPFTYFERFTMITAALVDEGWDPTEFAVVPSPITDIGRMPSYLPDASETVCFITIYDDWGREKQRELERLGYTTEVLWERSMADRLTSGSEIRDALASSAPWHHLVPPATIPYLERLRGRLAADAGRR